MSCSRLLGNRGKVSLRVYHHLLAEGGSAARCFRRGSLKHSNAVCEKRFYWRKQGSGTPGKVLPYSVTWESALKDFHCSNRAVTRRRRPRLLRAECSAGTSSQKAPLWWSRRSGRGRQLRPQRAKGWPWPSHRAGGELFTLKSVPPSTCTSSHVSVSKE